MTRLNILATGPGCRRSFGAATSPPSVVLKFRLAEPDDDPGFRAGAGATPACDFPALTGAAGSANSRAHLRHLSFCPGTDLPGRGTAARHFGHAKVWGMVSYFSEG